MRIGPMELILIFVVIAAVVGTKNLPNLGKNAGKAVRGLKANTQEITDAMKAVNEEVKEIKESLTLDSITED